MPLYCPRPPPFFHRSIPRPAHKRLDAGILCFLSWKHLGQIFWLARIHRCYATISVNGHRCYPPILRRTQRFLYLYKLEIYKTKENIQNIESKLLVIIFRKWNKFATCACKTILRKYPQPTNNFQKRKNPGGLFYGRNSTNIFKEASRRKSFYKTLILKQAFPNTFSPFLFLLKI